MARDGRDQAPRQGAGSDPLHGGRLTRGHESDEEGPRRYGRSSLLRSFNHAFDGLVFVFRYQRNMRIHIVLAVVVLGAALFFPLSALELLFVFAAISFVLIAEMLNTALEAAIDLFTKEYDPRARVAKDVAAGAVLVAAMNALAVAYFVFADKAADVTENVFASLRRSPSHLTFVTLVLLVFVVIMVKARAGRGTWFSGGLPSGHAAVAFGAWTAISFILVGSPYHFLVSALALFMALLTAQTRLEAGVHTLREVALGAAIGIVLTTLVFQILY